MSAASLWSGIKATILTLEKVEALAARLDDAASRMQALAERVADLRVMQATLENEQKHLDTKIGAAAILATERVNRDLLDRVSELERRLEELERPHGKKNQPTGLLKQPKSRTALAGTPKEDVPR